MVFSRISDMSSKRKLSVSSKRLFRCLGLRHMQYLEMLLAFLVASRYMKTDPKQNENFGFGLTIYTNRKVSYWLRLGSKTEPIVQTSTLDIWYKKADPKRTDNFGFGLTMYTNRKASYRLRLGSKTDPIIRTETLLLATQ